MLLIQIALVIEYVGVVLLIYECINDVAFSFILVNKLLFPLLLLVHLLLEEQLVSETIFLKLAKHSIQTIFIITFTLQSHLLLLQPFA